MLVSSQRYTQPQFVMRAYFHPKASGSAIQESAKLAMCGVTSRHHVGALAGSLERHDEHTAFWLAGALSPKDTLALGIVRVRGH
jgi:hypothetical protein